MHQDGQMKTHRRRNEGGEENTLYFLLPALKVKEVSPPEQIGFVDILLLQNSGFCTVQDWGRLHSCSFQESPRIPRQGYFFPWKAISGLFRRESYPF